MATLYVAIYRPSIATGGGNVHHWGFYLQHADKTSYIYEIVGTATKFVPNELNNVDPEATGRFKENVFVADIDSAGDIPDVKRVLKGVRIKNDVTHWMCHDWVLEVIEALEEDELVNEWDAAEAKRELEERYDK
ncbi:hypothetical protein EDC01DRAFT_658434 [Geopyxis carbonaria]|nr:hypothetical protein EDC01DRAFT_658434 [Geopyxis carbonaria]